MLNPIDRDELRRRVRSAKPFPHCLIDSFFQQHFAESVARGFPSYEEAARIGREFRSVNEKKKVQVTDTATFTTPIAEVNRLLASPDTLDLLSYVFDIPNLLADELLVGGGIHEMARDGHLDVHVDFNYIQDRQWHRRLNLLVYFNRDWEPAWGGDLELWDENVRRCEKSFAPLFNRCVVFATSEKSYHGVKAVKCPEGQARRSFAAYYYTREAPPDQTGEQHTTKFRGRPDEKIKSNILMPLERAGREMSQAVRRAKRGLKKMVRG
jgi:Rps23 Pro-64 3,4-dihydroxylase Tpa1-like proline 4-hydroxylase